LFTWNNDFAQDKNNSVDTTATKKLIDSINRGLDRAYVKRDIPFLQKHYAEDFYFLHATGMIDSKSSWIGKSGGSNSQLLLSREHDSTIVELHDNIAIVTGILAVLFVPAANRDGYAVRYIRVYALRNKTWQLISHHSTAQWTVKRE
jgi:ketosteroid isomerase-like protein